MDNKGFTLVELLAVITIISLITIVAVPSALTFQQNMNKKMFCSKVDSIETAAKLYGTDVYDSIDQKRFDGIPSLECPTSISNQACVKINVEMLLKKSYLKKEANNVKGTDTNGDGKIDEFVYDEFYDPRDYRSMLADNIIVYVENKRVYSRFVYNSEEDLYLCNPADSTDPNKDLYFKNAGGNIVKK